MSLIVVFFPSPTDFDYNQAIFLYFQRMCEKVMNIYSIWLKFLINKRDFDQELFFVFVFFAPSPQLHIDSRGH